MDAARLIASGAFRKDKKNSGHKDAKVLGVIVPEDLEDENEPEGIDKFELWEENEPTVNVFMFLLTQWHHAVKPNTGELIRTGMVYQAIPFAFKSLGIKKKHRPEITMGLRIMESSYLCASYKSPKAGAP